MIATFDTSLLGMSFRCSDDGTIGKAVKENKYELAELRCLSLALRPGKIFVDVGANVGYFTLYGARIVGPTGLVFSVEPEPDNIEILKHNVYSNKFGWVNICHCAAGYTSCTKRLYKNTEGNNGDHRTWCNEGPQQGEINDTSVTPLDYLCRHVPRIDVMKIDVQGDEVNVLKGASDIIRRSPGLSILVELWPYGLISNNSSMIELINFLYFNNFSICEIHPGCGHLAPTSRLELFHKIKPDADIVVNLWCTKGA